MKTHDISVIIPCYNVHNYLPEAMESVLDQTYPAKEIILVHDGCEGNIPTVQKGSTIIRGNHRGAAVSRDEGFHIANGEYILFLDADDVLAENFLEECVKVADEETIAYPSMLLWSHWHDEKPEPNVFYTAKSTVELTTLWKRNEVLVTSLMHCEIYNTIGPMDSSLSMYEDWDFWIKAAIHGYTFKRARTHLKYRQRQTSRNMQPDETKKEVISIIRARYQAKVNEIKG